MTRHRRPAGTAALTAAGLALALAGCSPAPSSAPATPSPEPEPATAAPTTNADPLESVSAVVIRPEGLDLVDAGGTVVTEISYDDEADAIADALATVFGAAAEIEEFPAVCCEGFRLTIYHWDGFRVVDDHMGSFTDGDERVWVDEDRPDANGMNVLVAADAASVGEVALAAENGFVIGDDLGALADAVGSPYTGAEWEQIPVETGPELGPPEFEGLVNAYSVVVQVAGPDGGPRLVAPINLGIPSV